MTDTTIESLKNQIELAKGVTTLAESVDKAISILATAILELDRDGGRSLLELDKNGGKSIVELSRQGGLSSNTKSALQTLAERSNDA